MSGTGSQKPNANWFPKPGPATSISEISRTATSITVSWHAPEEAISPVYQIRYRIKGQSNWTSFPAKTTSTQLEVTGLKPNTVYEFEVEATNGN